MANFFEAKTAADTKVYSFLAPVVDGDAAASVTLTASGITLGEYEIAGDYINFTVSGGTAGQTASVVVLITTDGGETLQSTIYIPIIASAAQIAETGRDYVTFALRKIIGSGEDPDATQLTDGLQHLNDLVAEWRAGGADIGAPFPIVAASVIYCPDYAASALRYNLMERCLADYPGAEMTPSQFNLARRGLQLIKHGNLPDVRTAEFY